MADKTLEAGFFAGALPLCTDFVYLAVLLDGFSRKVVGLALEKALVTRLPLAALHQALRTPHPPLGWRPKLIEGSNMLRRVCEGIRLAPDDPEDEHESAGEPYDHSNYESFMNSEAGGTLRDRVSRSGPSADEPRRLH